MGKPCTLVYAHREVVLGRKHGAHPKHPLAITNLLSPPYLSARLPPIICVAM